MAPNTPTDVAKLIDAKQYLAACEALLQLASDGDCEALYTLAMWRVSGRVIRRDKEIARQTLERAAEKGHWQSQKVLACFRAAGVGCDADWNGAFDLATKLARQDANAAEQVELVNAMSLLPDGMPSRLPELRSLSECPAVWTAAGFLSPDECRYIVRMAEPRMAPAMVTDRATGRSMPHPVRRSDGAIFGVTDEDIVISAINRRIAAISRTQIDHAEPLQVLRYRAGDEFRPHVDTVADGGNQRILTALLYLGDDYEGGETTFCRGGLQFKGPKGDILLFANVTREGRPDPLAEHAGLPVTRGTKIIASRWIWRDRPSFQPPSPLVSGF